MKNYKDYRVYDTDNIIHGKTMIIKHVGNER